MRTGVALRSSRTEASGGRRAASRLPDCERPALGPSNSRSLEAPRPLPVAAQPSGLHPPRTRRRSTKSDRPSPYGTCSPSLSDLPAHPPSAVNILPEFRRQRAPTFLEGICFISLGLERVGVFQSLNGRFIIIFPPSVQMNAKPRIESRHSLGVSFSRYFTRKTKLGPSYLYLSLTFAATAVDTALSIL